MAIHPSLSGSDKTRKQRSVLKRIERLKLMSQKNQWNDSDDVFGLPKMKTLRIKIKKEKAEKTETAAAEASATAPGQKEQAAPPKAGASKGSEKK